MGWFVKFLVMPIFCAIEISALKVFCWVLWQVCCRVPFHSICGKSQKPTNPKSQNQDEEENAGYNTNWWAPPQPIALPAVRRLAPAAIGCREGNNITKFIKIIQNSTRPTGTPTVFFALPLRQLWTLPTWRPPAPFSCSCSLTSSQFHSQPSFKCQQHCSDSCFFAFLPLWVTKLVCGCWVCAENYSRNLVGFKIPFNLFL